VCFTPFLGHAFYIFYLGNQSQVRPVTDLKSGRPRQCKPAANGSGSHKSNSLQNLIPTGWAPGPVGEGASFTLPPLKIALPEQYTAPLAHEHYEAVRNQLRKRITAGGQDAVTVIIDGRLTSQEPGRIKPYVINVQFRSMICSQT
jgi:hypothetical protein